MKENRNYDFTSIMDRRNRDALAVDRPEGAIGRPIHIKEGFDLIPMWVADMNFPTFPGITEAVRKRMEHPSFGYFDPSDQYYDSIIRWQESRHQVLGLNRECIGYENGVLGGVVSALNVLCSKGDKVLLHTPTYVGFTGTLVNNGYHIVHSPLKLDEDQIWRMDLEDMERRLAEEKIHTAIFCSPHNPCGRVWERRELERMMELFRKYEVTVISDEIWSDIILDGNKHIPTQSVSEDAKNRTIALYAPSKTFSLAGLVGSYHIIYNRMLRDRMEKESSLSHYNNMNVLSMHALTGAYSVEGERWVDELCQVITENVTFACDYIREDFEGVKAAVPEGTYMLFLDCTRWCEEHGKSIEELLKAGCEVGVIWQDGRKFQKGCHIRMNLALPFVRVQEAFRRLDQYVFHG